MLKKRNVEYKQVWEETGVTIFEIPIYAFTPDEFKRRWRIKIDRLIKPYVASGYTCEEATKMMMQTFYCSSVWRYNLLVGVLQLTARRGFLYFNLYCNKRKTTRQDMICSLPFQNCYLLDFKTEVLPDETDEELVHNILGMIHSLQIIEGIENYYFDCEALKSSLSANKVREVLEKYV